MSFCFFVFVSVELESIKLGRVHDWRVWLCRKWMPRKGGLKSFSLQISNFTGCLGWIRYSVGGRLKASRRVALNCIVVQAQWCQRTRLEWIPSKQS